MFCWSPQRTRATSPTILRVETAQTLERKFWIKLEFNPTAVSHFGGSWDFLMKKIQRFLLQCSRITHPRRQNHVNLCLRNRSSHELSPMTNVSSDSADSEPPTHNHSLLGRPAVNMPPGFSRDIQQTRLHEALTQQFWKRFLRDYLPTRSQRQKCAKPGENL